MMNTKEKGDEIIEEAVKSKPSYQNEWKCYEEFKRRLHDLCIFNRDIDLVNALEL